MVKTIEQQIPGVAQQSLYRMYMNSKENGDIIRCSKLGRFTLPAAIRLLWFLERTNEAMIALTK